MRTDEGVLVDLYELTMLQVYLAHDMTGSASFELFVRSLPPGRGFLVAAGLEQALQFLEGFRLTETERQWLAGRGGLDGAFLERLAGLRFTGDVDAVPEGTILFPGEPILRVTAPLPEAQVVETRLLNLVHLQTLLATKATRVVLAAAGRPVIDFGLRRAHGAEAGLFAARACYLAGYAGTSNVLAGARFDIPLYGTMAHSFVQAHDDEEVAFERFARVHPANVVLLLDTYDTEAAARAVAALAPRLAHQGIRVAGVRLDSGDLAAHARRVRQVLDAAGLREIRILASSGLDEEGVGALVASGAPVDGFATGTRVVTSADAPFLDAAYKLVEYAGRPRHKRSEGKATHPGRKQVYRRFDLAGRIAGDRLALADEPPPEGVPLLRPVMRAGRRLEPPIPLASLRDRAATARATLPDPLRRLERAPVPVEISERLAALGRRTR